MVKFVMNSKMKRHSHRVVACALTLVVAIGGALARVEPAVAERLLEKSGTLAQIGGVPVQFKAQFEELLREQKTGTATRDDVIRWLAAIERQMEAADLRRSIVSGVAERLSADDVGAIDAWYDSPVGTKMLRLEADAAKGDSVAALRDGAAMLRMLPGARVNALSELLSATRASDFVTELSIDMSVGAAHAVASATSPTPPPVSALRESANRERAQIEKSVSDSLLAAYAKTYEKASDAELAAYRDFMLSRAGKSLSSAVIAAFSRALTVRTADIARVLSEQARAQRR